MHTMRGQKVGRLCCPRYAYYLLFLYFAGSAWASEIPSLLVLAKDLHCAPDAIAAGSHLEQFYGINLPGKALPNEWFGTEQAPSLHAGSLDIALDVLIATSRKYPELKPSVEQVILQWSYCEVMVDEVYYDFLSSSPSTDSNTKTELTAYFSAFTVPLQWRGFHELGLYQYDDTAFEIEAYKHRYFIHPLHMEDYHELFRERCLPHPETGQLFIDINTFFPNRVVHDKYAQVTPYPYQWDPSCDVPALTQKVKSAKGAGLGESILGELSEDDLAEMAALSAQHLALEIAAEKAQVEANHQAVRRAKVATAKQAAQVAKAGIERKAIEKAEAEAARKAAKMALLKKRRDESAELEKMRAQALVQQAKERERERVLAEQQRMEAEREQARQRLIAQNKAKANRLTWGDLLNNQAWSNHLQSDHSLSDLHATEHPIVPWLLSSELAAMHANPPYGKHGHSHSHEDSDWYYHVHAEGFGPPVNHRHPHAVMLAYEPPASVTLLAEQRRLAAEAFLAQQQKEQKELEERLVAEANAAALLEAEQALQALAELDALFAEAEGQVQALTKQYQSLNADLPDNDSLLVDPLAANDSGELDAAAAAGMAGDASSLGTSLSPSTLSFPAGTAIPNSVVDHIGHSNGVAKEAGILKAAAIKVQRQETLDKQRSTSAPLSNFIGGSGVNPVLVFDEEESEDKGELGSSSSSSSSSSASSSGSSSKPASKPKATKKPKKNHGFSGSFSVSNKSFDSKGFGLSGGVGFKPIKDSFWFVRTGGSYKFEEGKFTYGWGIGYDDWHSGTFAVQVNHWGPLEIGDGFDFENSIAAITYKVDSEKLKKKRMSSSLTLSQKVSGKPSMSLSGSWSPAKNWFMRSTLSQDFRGGSLKWAYGFGYANYTAFTFSFEYNNWGPNTAFKTNFQKNGILALTYRWRY